MNDTLRIILQAIANKENKASVVQIEDDIFSRTGLTVEISKIYYNLALLDNQGFVSFKKSKKTNIRGGKAVIYFSTTSKGRTALKKSFLELKQMGCLNETL